MEFFNFELEFPKAQAPLAPFLTLWNKWTLFNKFMKHLPRSQEALVEAAYHIIFGPWANLKGRQQLHGTYEWNKKKVILSLSFWLVLLFGYFSSRLSLWLGSSCRWGWMENKFPGLTRNCSVLQGCCPRKPVMCINLSETAAAAGLCISWEFPLLVLDIPRVLSHPTIGLGRQDISDICQITRAFLGMFSQQEDRLIINENSKATIWKRDDSCLVLPENFQVFNSCLTCIPFLNTNIRIHGWRRTSEMGTVLRNPGYRVALMNMTLNSRPVRCTNMKHDFARGHTMFGAKGLLPSMYAPWPLTK